MVNLKQPTIRTYDQTPPHMYTYIKEIIQVTLQRTFIKRRNLPPKINEYFLYISN